MKVRFKFAKYGAMKFLGHLDMMRFFQKAIRRSKIDIAYTEGYSPHQVLSFAAPLSVGCTSEGEYFDIRLNPALDGESIDCARLKEQLNAVMVEGIRILEVGLLGEQDKNAMASVEAAAYLAGFRRGTLLPEDWQGKLLSFYARETIPVTKKTKGGERELNLKDSIYELRLWENVRENPICREEDMQKEGVYMLLNASSGGNIKPGFVLDTFFDTLSYHLPDYALMVHRIELYQNIGTTEKRKLVPLLWEN